MGAPLRCDSPAVHLMSGWPFDVQIVQVGHKLVYNEAVLVHVKINILFCVSGWQDAAIPLAFAKRVLGAGAAPLIVAAQFVSLHYVKEVEGWQRPVKSCNIVRPPNSAWPPSSSCSLSHPFLWMGTEVGKWIQCLVGGGFLSDLIPVLFVCRLVGGEEDILESFVSNHFLAGWGVNGNFVWGQPSRKSVQMRRGMFNLLRVKKKKKSKMRIWKWGTF